MTAPDHLYGLPGAEHMHTDLASAYEEYACDFNDGEVPDVTIEEWSVKDAAPDDLTLRWWLEILAERAAEDGDENYWGKWEAAVEAKDVWAAFRAAVDLAASKVGYRMADEHLCDHRIEHLDGEPYHVGPDGEHGYKLYGARRG